MAPDAKTVVIASDRRRVCVTVLPGPRLPPYTSAELLGSGTTAIDRLPARCCVDERGRRYLEVEAGTPGLGPTYRLYPTIADATGRRVAGDEVPVEDVVLLPNTSIGLYDDWDDDLGVPWAYPLDPLIWRPHPPTHDR